MIKVGKIVGEMIGTAYTLKDNDSFTISRQTVSNSIRNARIFDVTVPKQETPETIYSGGRKYVHLNTGKNMMVKSAVIFEGIE